MIPGQRGEGGQIILFVMKLSLETLLSHLRGQLAPLYLVTGDEALLVAEAGDAIRARARAEGYSEREVHFVERATDWPALDGSIATMSLFGNRRLLEILLATVGFNA